jgi:Fe-S-cluster-containing hydrogenase component 2
MIAVNVHACPQNHPCPAVQYCPEGAIVQDDIYSAPRIEEELCTECGACAKVCHVFTKVPDKVPVG